MNFIQHPLCDDVLGAPKGVPIEECRALPILRASIDGIPVVQSFWQPDAIELEAIKAGHPVILTVWGHTHPPVLLQVLATK